MRLRCRKSHCPVGACSGHSGFMDSAAARAEKYKMLCRWGVDSRLLRSPAPMEASQVPAERCVHKAGGELHVFQCGVSLAGKRRQDSLYPRFVLICNLVLYEVIQYIYLSLYQSTPAPSSLMLLQLTHGSNTACLAARRCHARKHDARRQQSGSTPRA
jgi:hypothetical protein